MMMTAADDERYGDGDAEEAARFALAPTLTRRAR